MIFFSCNNDIVPGWEREIESVDDMLEAFSNEINVNAEIFIEDSLNLLRPFRFKFFSNYLIINDKTDGFVYSIYDLDDEKFIGRFIKRGKGPNEYLSPYLFNFGSDSIGIIDEFHPNRLAIYSEAKIIEGNSVPDRSIQLYSRNKGDVISRCFAENDRLIATGQFKESRFIVYNKAGVIQDEFGNYANVNSDVDIDNYQLGFIFNGHEIVRSNLALSKIACLDKYSLTIYDRRNDTNSFQNRFNLSWSIANVKEATYKQGKPYVVRMGKGAKVGAGNLASTDKFLFFPFSKLELEQTAKQGIRDYFEYILVMDWNGEPIAKLNIEKRIQFPLEVDISGSYLYSTHVDTETGLPQIIRYDIGFLSQL